MAVPRKRKHSGEETLPEKRQKKTIEASKFAEQEKSITALIRLRETKVDPKVTRLIHENTAWRIRDHDTKTKEGEVITTNQAVTRLRNKTTVSKT